MVRIVIAYKVMVPFDMPEKVIRVSDRILEKSKVKFRTVKKSDWDNEVNRMHEIYNDAWEKNWGFIPMTDNESIFHFFAKGRNSRVMQSYTALFKRSSH